MGGERCCQNWSCHARRDQSCTFVVNAGEVMSNSIYRLILNQAQLGEISALILEGKTSYLLLRGKKLFFFVPKHGTVANQAFLG